MTKSFEVLSNGSSIETNKKRAKPFQTAYEMRKQQIMVVLQISVWTSVLSMLLGGFFADRLTNDPNTWGPILSLAPLVIHIIFWSTYFPIATKKMRMEHIVSAEYYRTTSQESIFTKFDLIVVGAGGKRKRIKKPVVIDRIGVRNHEIEILWKDYKIELDLNALFGFDFRLVSNKNKSAVETILTPKNFYLIKNFSGLTDEKMSELEKFVRTTGKLNTKADKRASM